MMGSVGCGTPLADREGASARPESVAHLRYSQLSEDDKISIRDFQF